VAAAAAGCRAQAGRPSQQAQPAAPPPGVRPAWPSAACRIGRAVIAVFSADGKAGGRRDGGTEGRRDGPRRGAPAQRQRPPPPLPLPLPSPQNEHKEVKVDDILGAEEAKKAVREALNMYQVRRRLRARARAGGCAAMDSSGALRVGRPRRPAAQGGAARRPAAAAGEARGAALGFMMAPA
jgi:hypothetical protein